MLPITSDKYEVIFSLSLIHIITSIECCLNANEYRSFKSLRVVNSLRAYNSQMLRKDNFKNLSYFLKQQPIVPDSVLIALSPMLKSTFNLNRNILNLASSSA